MKKLNGKSENEGIDPRNLALMKKTYLMDRDVSN